MKNVTITLNEKTAAWARAYAGKAGMSMSRFIGALLEQRMHEIRHYNEAMRLFFAQRPTPFDFAGGRRPTREELHDRADLR